MDGLSSYPIRHGFSPAFIDYATILSVVEFRVNVFGVAGWSVGRN